jgi:hypothetical protein
MLAIASKLALVAALLTLLAPTADAQRVHPRCAKVKDKAMCTCFFENGGQVVDRLGGGKRAQIWSDSDAEGYIRCMRRNGRANG